MYTRNTTIVSSSAIQVYFIGEKADISLCDIFKPLQLSQTTHIDK